MSVGLPDQPKDDLYEHLIFACYNCFGFYVEYNLQERIEGTDVLELDGMATLFTEKMPCTILLECKSGPHGFADFFKVVGWMKYLNIEYGALIGPSKGDSKKDAILKFKGKELNVEILMCEDQKTAIAEFITIYGNEFSVIDDLKLEIWRYSYMLITAILRILKHKQKSANKDTVRYKHMQCYYEQVNNSVFFTRNIIDRISSLYDAYKENPNISLKCSYEMQGQDFNTQGHTQIDRVLFKEAFIDCNFTDLQLSAFIEHRSRIAILKNAIELDLLQKNGVDDDRTETIIHFLGLELDKIRLLPSTYQSGIKEISKDQYYYLYPRFWQWFIFFFGGFIMMDRKDDEFSCISENTGIPIEHIDLALASYGKLFPNDWIITNTYSNVKHVKLMPPVIMGIGAYYRLRKYTTDEKYNSISNINEYCIRHLSGWHNAAYHALKTE